MRRMQDLISGAVDREEVIRTVRARRVLRQWPEIVGPGLASRSYPDKYDHGTVFVAVEGSAWAQELRMIRDTILRRLQSRAGDARLFTDLRFGVRPLPKEAPAPVTEAESEGMPVERLSIREIAERRLKAWGDDAPGA